MTGHPSALLVYRFLTASAERRRQVAGCGRLPPERTGDRFVAGAAELTIKPDPARVGVGQVEAIAHYGKIGVKVVPKRIGSLDDRCERGGTVECGDINRNGRRLANLCVYKSQLFAGLTTLNIESMSMNHTNKFWSLVLLQPHVHLHSLSSRGRIGRFVRKRFPFRIPCCIFPTLSGR